VAEDDGLPPVTGNIVIIGGPGTQISHGRSAGLFRILEVSGGALTLVDLTVANGQLAGEDGFDDEGGGIRDAGTLVLRHVRLTGNSNRGGFGGGLYVDGGAHATISDSDLDGNSATGGSGGAIFSLGDLTVDRSALAANTAANGGGIFNLSPGTVTLRSTLVAFNSPDNCSPQGTIGAAGTSPLAVTASPVSRPGAGRCGPGTGRTAGPRPGRQSRPAAPASHRSSPR
jgi:predicted outer membrane repeat protein